ncbi:MAG: hypothetical protein OHK0013_26400 [Sandaracinaceae bacterium]
MARFDVVRAQEAIEAARVARARVIVAALASTLERLAAFLRGMASRGLPEAREPALPSSPRAV